MNKKAKGISFYSPNNKWRAQICRNKEVIHLGYFDTEEEALQARKLAEEKYFKEFAYK